jgi:hypothetical protein
MATRIRSGRTNIMGLPKAFLAVVKDGRWVPVADKPLGY